MRSSHCCARLTAGWQPGDGRTVFCVGDPMQSIYRFRQAEVRAFLELAEDGIGDLRFDVQRLSSNFRSAASLVDWVNARFAQLLPAADDRSRGAIAHRPSTARRPTPPGVEAGVSMAGHATRRREAEANATLIAATLTAHPDWRIAVLVRAKSHAAELAGELRRRHIAFSAIDIEPLRDRPIVRDLLMLTRALLHAGDRIAWLAVLRAPWCGIELGDLLLLARAAPLLCQSLADSATRAQLTAPGRDRCERLWNVLEPALRLHGDRSWVRLGRDRLAGTRRPGRRRRRQRSRARRGCVRAAARTRARGPARSCRVRCGVRRALRARHRAGRGRDHDHPQGQGPRVRLRDPPRTRAHDHAA